jgi:hypothetical protein
VNWRSDFLRHDEVLDALFGGETYRIDQGTGEAIPSRGVDGAWISSSGMRNTRVSGLLVGATFPSSIAQRAPELYHNPCAATPASTFLPQVAHWMPRQGKMERVDAMTTPAQLFGLRAEWPADPREGPLSD